jgi:HEAT repeat protein
MRYVTRIAILLLALARPAAAAQPQEAISVDQAFEQLKGYEYGQSDRALRAIELYVGRFATDAARKAQVAERLAAVLAEPKTPQAAKVFICQQLLVVGTEAQVPLVAKMLDEPETAEIARYTLEAIPGKASLEALRGALGRLKGKPLVGAINSLGIRRDFEAVEALARLLADPDPQLAAAAAESLGKIATAQAAAALVKAEAPAKARVALHNARLQCAERLAAAGDAVTAVAVYEHAWSSSRSAEQRLGGLIGLAKVAPDKAAPLVLEAIASDDPLVQATAVGLAGRLPGPKVTAALVGRLDKLNAAGELLLLAALAERGDRSAAEAVAKRMDDKEEAVRIAAVRAMARLGDASTADRLAQLAATAGGAAQQAARASLAGLMGAGVEAKLLALAAGGEPAVRIEALRALAARRSAAAAPVLLKAATDADAQIRLAALDCLAAVAQAESYAKLVELLVTAATPAETAAAQRAVLAVGTSLASAQAARIGAWKERSSP